MLHGSRVCSFHVSTVIRTANSFNKSAAKVRTVKCYNVVHNASMISSFILTTSSISFILVSHLAGDFTASSFSHSSYALRSNFDFLYFLFYLIMHC